MARLAYRKCSVRIKYISYIIYYIVHDIYTHTYIYIYIYWLIYILYALFVTCTVLAWCCVSPLKQLLIGCVDMSCFSMIVRGFAEGTAGRVVFFYGFSSNGCQVTYICCVWILC